MHIVPARLESSVVPFHVARVAEQGDDPLLPSARYNVHCKALTVWVAWGEPGGSFYHAQPVKFCLN